jgi:rhodanese-related sulfurtransferase
MAEASECAAEQGKFWEAVDKIYEHQSDLTEEALKRDAAEIGLDSGKFGQCMASGATAAGVERDRQDGLALGVNATPTIFIGHQVISASPDLDEFSRLIDQELAGQVSGIPRDTPPIPETPPITAPGEKWTQSPNKAASATQKPAPASSGPASSSFGLLGSSPGGALSGFQSGITCSDADAAKKQPTLIHTPELRELLAGNSKPLLVDVRLAKEYATGKIPGAINIPVDDMPKRYGTLPKNRVIVFYEGGKSSGDVCASGRAAGRVLLEHGYAFEQVKVYQDGLAGWEKSGLDAGK